MNLNEIEILNQIEEYRTTAEKAKLNIKYYQDCLRNPEPDITLELQQQFYSRKIEEAENTIQKNKELILEFRKFLSAEVLEYYNQELFMVTLKA